MSMDELYLEMKEALRYFNLRFSEMGQVEITIAGNCIFFKYNGRAISIPFGEPE